MGENPKYVFVTGSPSIDELVQENFTDKKTLMKKYNVKLDNHTIILLQHPVTTQNEYAEKQIKTKTKEINTDILPGEPRPNLSTDMNYVNSIADTYDKNSLFVQERQKELLSEGKNKDLKSNEWQDQKNNESKREMDELKMQILDLSKVVSDLAKTIQAPEPP